MMLMTPRQASDPHSDSSPRPAAGLVMAGRREHFSGETLSLLRSRLTFAAMLSAIVLFGTFVFDLFIRGLTLAGSHLAVSVAFAAGYALLRSTRPLSARQLRFTEVVLFALLNILL